MSPECPLFPSSVDDMQNQKGVHGCTEFCIQNVSKVIFYLLNWNSLKCVITSFFVERIAQIELFFKICIIKSICLINLFFQILTKVGAKSGLPEFLGTTVELSLGTRIFRISQITGFRALHNSEAEIEKIATIAAHDKATQNKYYNFARRPELVLSARRMLYAVRKTDRLKDKPVGADGVEVWQK